MTTSPGVIPPFDDP